MNKKSYFLILSVALLSSFLGLSHSQASPEHYTIDPVHSTVSFTIKHLMISKVTGFFTDFAGTGTFDPENPESSSIEVTVQAASVNTNNAKRDTHLLSDEFFDVKKYPTLSFKSTSIKKSSEDTYEITGDFTLKGVSKPVTFSATITDQIDGMKPGEKRRGGAAGFRIKRSDFGMDHMLGPIGEDVEITLSFSGIQQ